MSVDVVHEILHFLRREPAVIATPCGFAAPHEFHRAEHQRSGVFITRLIGSVRCRKCRKALPQLGVIDRQQRMECDGGIDFVGRGEVGEMPPGNGDEEHIGGGLGRCADRMEFAVSGEIVDTPGVAFENGVFAAVHPPTRPETARYHHKQMARARPLKHPFLLRMTADPPRHPRLVWKRRQTRLLHDIPSGSSCVVADAITPQ